MPMPRPDTSVTFSAVLRPGAQMSCVDLAGSHCLGVGLRDQTAFNGLAANALDIEPLAVVADLNHDAVAAMVGVQGDGPLARLSRGLADLGQLDAVVRRVAHQMDQRIAQFVDHPLVELGLFAIDHQAHALAVAWVMSRMTRLKRVNSGPIGTMRMSITLR